MSGAIEFLYWSQVQWDPWEVEGQGNSELWPIILWPIPPLHLKKNVLRHSLPCWLSYYDK